MHRATKLITLPAELGELQGKIVLTRFGLNNRYNGADFNCNYSFSIDLILTGVDNLLTGADRSLYVCFLNKLIAKKLPLANLTTLVRISFLLGFVSRLNLCAIQRTGVCTAAVFQPYRLIWPIFSVQNTQAPFMVDCWLPGSRHGLVNYRRKSVSKADAYNMTLQIMVGLLHCLRFFVIWASR